MASATESSTVTPTAAHAQAHGPAHAPSDHAPVTPGKVAMWLFLATEVMFFTGLIGTYIVLRAGSAHDTYSNIYSPATPLKRKADRHGILITSVGATPESVAHVLHTYAGVSEEEAEKLVEKLVEEAPHGVAVVSDLKPAKAQEVLRQLAAAGATAEDEPLKTYKWPKPYDRLTDPLDINLTAFNTFILICSSVTMVLALAAIKDGKTRKGSMFLLATVLIGSTFLSIQVFEYYHLMQGEHWPPGISATGHFRPSVSLFASCFFTMTGFHGAHVTGGVILLSIIFILSFFFNAFSSTNYAPVELAGLYWHFVDLVWIILFTIVYLI
jgi:heme/copper-type cytochrome/quinol oxidase subunit 3